jgi:hypothetical protein
MNSKDYDEMIQTCLKNIKASTTEKERDMWKTKLKYWQDRKKGAV